MKSLEDSHLSESSDIQETLKKIIKSSKIPIPNFKISVKKSQVLI